jgi:hypothetical protein
MLIVTDGILYKWANLRKHHFLKNFANKWEQRDWPEIVRAFTIARFENWHDICTFKRGRVFTPA